ncbi:MAG: hypothetical protein U0L26_06495, partial [Cellulosilyticum sp.]|nr:hypothetical protein [Cellulosilyticum sp.]
MINQEFEEFLKLCHKEVLDKQKYLTDTYQINQYKNYNFSQNDKALTLTMGEESIKFKVVCIGSWKSEDSSWVWAWANENISEEMREEAKVLRELANETKFNVFMQGGFECEQSVARDLAFMAVHHLDAKGIYRIEVDGSFLFLALMDICEEKSMENSLDWSLNELYDSFEGEAYQGDLKKLDALIKELVEVADEMTKDHENEKEKLEHYIGLSEKMSLTFEKLGVYAELIVSVNSKDELANKYADVVDQKQSELAEPETKISKWISEIQDLDAVIESSERLKEFSFFFKEIVEHSKHLLNEREEMIIAKMKNTGSTAWVNYKNLLISTHKVELEQNGIKEELPLTVVLNMAYDKDKELRKKAYEAEIASYKKIEEGIAAALNGIKGEVLTVSKLRGYAS